MHGSDRSTVTYFRYAEQRQKDKSKKYLVLILGDNYNIIVHPFILYRSWNGLTNWKDIASPNLYMHLTGKAFQQHAENPEEQRKLHLRSVAQAFSPIEKSTSSSMSWQRTFRTCQYQWAHSVLKGPFWKLLYEHDKEKLPILKKLSVFIFVSHWRHIK